MSEAGRVGGGRAMQQAVRRVGEKRGEKRRERKGGSTGVLNEVVEDKEDAEFPQHSARFSIMHCRHFASSPFVPMLSVLYAISCGAAFSTPKIKTDAVFWAGSCSGSQDAVAVGRRENVCLNAGLAKSDQKPQAI